MSQTEVIEAPAASYRGLRMSADEYLALPEDGFRYELVDGVVCITPSASFEHQSVASEVLGQIAMFLRQNPIGRAVAEVDVKLRDDLVYRPDIVYLRADKVARTSQHIREVPDLVVEVISPDSRRYDRETKRQDYEAAGVGEYWLIDPQRRTFTFYVLDAGALREVPPAGKRYRATVLPGFELDLESIERLF